MIGSKKIDGMLHRIMKRFPLHFQILAAIFLGIVYGFALPEQTVYVAWLGDVFLRLLKMVVVPLVFCSLVTAITGIRGSGRLGRIGGKAIALYLLTSLVAILTGLFLVNAIRPGAGIDIAKTTDIPSLLVEQRPLYDILIGIVPENLFADLAAGKLLSLVFFAIFFGVFLNLCRSADEESRENGNQHDVRLSAVDILARVFEGGFDVMMRLTGFLMRLAPLGVFGIIAKNAAIFGQDSNMLASLGQGLGLHFLVVFTGLAIHLFLTQSLFLWLLGKANPWKHLRNMSSVLLTAFSTASSNATLPVSIQSTVEKDGVSEETAAFMLPLGATVNMDGTSLYECAVVLFVAQAYGVDLSLWQQVIVVLTVLLTGIGTAGIPMASLVMIVIVLHAVGLPAEGIGLVLAVDRPLDMCRTAVNVYGDTCCTVIVAKSEGETLNV